ncbi:DNA-binding NarL/FixJ family response regulator [Rhizobium metallidurans]|uniref:DNA-binding NarL/FixJ family response regulator n=2 Tax=Rhizobium metallidurans TaxID=1265931 RepID=A0A7W6GBT9_9HYPH|nr:DNA-binding NarL/FixJ family response regulator [Rhizobium metallidurans]
MSENAGLMQDKARGETVKILFIDDEFIEFRSLKKTLSAVTEPMVELDYAQSVRDALAKIGSDRFDLILLDNRLLPNADFRQTVPKLRAASYTGPIGVISMDVSDSYFQQFQDYGVDFRIGKDELDVETLQYIIREYVRYDMPDVWKDDYNI